MRKIQEMFERMLTFGASSSSRGRDDSSEVIDPDSMEVDSAHASSRQNDVTVDEAMSIDPFCQRNENGIYGPSLDGHQTCEMELLNHSHYKNHREGSLVEAAACGDLDQVTSLLDYDVRINTRGRLGLGL